MSSTTGPNRRVLSGMRPTGGLHLGHLHGALNNWLRLQYEYDCFFFVADWHALTTHYEDTSIIAPSVREMLVEWLAVGINPSAATIFVQSDVPEHAELHLLLSMITPLGWLERVPTYKDQQEKLKERDLATYGFLGYPLLQSADILMYRAGHVPVGEDQVAHVEITREVARRFNHLYGREADFEQRAERAMRHLGGKQSRLYADFRKSYQERGDEAALESGRALVENHPRLTMADRERLLGYLEGVGRTILVEPEALLTHTPRVPGLDGQKMSKSYGNTIGLGEAPEAVEKKLRTMQTDPARVRRTDPGEPEKCPVWQFHQIYSGDAVQSWVQEGCRSAGIGCIECKQPVIDAVLKELQPIRERIIEFTASPGTVDIILSEGRDRARDAARETMDDVRDAMGLEYR
ncbi:tryptophan--tRNA ligase [Wenzhouxiangella sp. XN24]|uniref:tryptophan--tRNA ligase n=1 Tax=Wenzhouxiangella sp. XN24 TaxID=2713569 RepID=UPI0013EDECD9|nr:tryptophan--tRNA ligase [Wenzhouxiangella sp. XN24]NGX16438.1 tryptophan--tRNA ligase [Wenzhouxiangella sp. XN24]